MAASTFDGSLTFWHQGLPLDAIAKTGTDGSFVYWHQGLGLLRNLGGGAPTVPTYFAVVDAVPVRGPIIPSPYGAW